MCESVKKKTSFSIDDILTGIERKKSVAEPVKSDWDDRESNCSSSFSASTGSDDEREKERDRALCEPLITRFHQMIAAVQSQQPQLPQWLPTGPFAGLHHHFHMQNLLKNHQPITHPYYPALIDLTKEKSLMRQKHE